MAVWDGLVEFILIMYFFILWIKFVSSNMISIIVKSMFNMSFSRF